MYADAFTKQVCKRYGISGNVRFAFKCYFIQQPEKTFFSIFIATILLLSYILRVFELPFLRAEDA